MNHVIFPAKCGCEDCSRGLSKVYANSSNLMSVNKKVEMGKKVGGRSAAACQNGDHVSLQPAPYHEAKHSNAPLISHWIYVGENET